MNDPQLSSQLDPAAIDAGFETEPLDRGEALADQETAKPPTSGELLKHINVTHERAKSYWESALGLERSNDAVNGRTNQQRQGHLAERLDFLENNDDDTVLDPVKKEEVSRDELIIRSSEDTIEQACSDMADARKKLKAATANLDGAEQQINSPDVDIAYLEEKKQQVFAMHASATHLGTYLKAAAEDVKSYFAWAKDQSQVSRYEQFMIKMLGQYRIYSEAALNEVQEVDQLENIFEEEAKSLGKADLFQGLGELIDAKIKQLEDKQAEQPDGAEQPVAQVKPEDVHPDEEKGIDLPLPAEADVDQAADESGETDQAGSDENAAGIDQVDEKIQQTVEQIQGQT